ncbi:MAG: metal-sulfur cluster assembly factor [Acidimicrobiales bacterium]
MSWFARGSGPPPPISIRENGARSVAGDPVETAWLALEGVYDPELCLDVVSLGLVYDVRESAGGVTVVMTLTTPGCPAAESLPDLARETIADAFEPGTPVEVQVVWEPPWTPAMMSDDAATALGFS